VIRFLDDPLKTEPSAAMRKDMDIMDSDFKKSAWCNPRVRSRLAEGLYLTHRYLLHMKYKLKMPTMRFLQIAKAHGMTELMKLP
jgi:hypothetical protein